jgi:hypothetical protein
MESNAIEEHLKQVEEAMEEVKHKEKEMEGWLSYISLSTAIIAILTALVGLYESQITSKTILTKNEAVLYQSQASDQWNFYQAKSVKSHIYAVNAELFPEKAEEFKKNADEYKNKIIEQGLYKNIKLAKIDRNKNGIPDAMMKDIDNDGTWDIIAYDTDEDGSYDRVTSFR